VDEWQKDVVLRVSGFEIGGDVHGPGLQVVVLLLPLLPFPDGLFFFFLAV
jgi:hypothetical protein